MLADSSCRRKVDIAGRRNPCRCCSAPREFDLAEAAQDPISPFCSWLRRPLLEALRVKCVPTRMFAKCQAFLFAIRKVVIADL